MKTIRKIIEIDEELCDGCGQCVPSCAEGALQIIDGKAHLVKDIYCDGLGACMGECPTGALKIVEREAEEFDETAVEEYLTEKEADSSQRLESAKSNQRFEPTAEKSKPTEMLTMACGCPSTHIQEFKRDDAAQGNLAPRNTDSALTHFPIKIRLVPAKAPFLKGADLLILADCVAVAFPALHSDLLNGKVVLMGCPKFDDVQEYITKFTDIFKVAGIRSITVAMMEVPCCSGLVGMVKKAKEKAKKNIPIKQIVISPKGHIIEEKTV